MTTTHDMFPHHDSGTQLPEGADDGLVERLRALYGLDLTVMERLKALYDAGGGSSTNDGFAGLLRTTVMQALRANPAFLENAKEMKNASPQRQVEISDTQRQLYGQYEAAVLDMAGIASDAGLDAKAVARLRIQAILEEKLSDRDDLSDEEILSALGIMSYDDEGREHFSYPADLLPATTNEKWQRYLDLVAAQVAMSSQFHEGGASKQEMVEIDRARTRAHNAVTRDVHDVLGLEGGGWDMLDTRGLVAKMRDESFPNQDTRESRLTTQAVRAGLGFVAIDRALQAPATPNNNT